MASVSPFIKNISGVHWDDDGGLAEPLYGNRPKYILITLTVQADEFTEGVTISPFTNDYAYGGTYEQPGTCQRDDTELVEQLGGSYGMPLADAWYRLRIAERASDYMILYYPNRDCPDPFLDDGQGWYIMRKNKTDVTFNTADLTVDQGGGGKGWMYMGPSWAAVNLDQVKGPLIPTDEIPYPFFIGNPEYQWRQPNESLSAFAWMYGYSGSVCVYPNNKYDPDPEVFGTEYQQSGSSVTKEMVKAISEFNLDVKWYDKEAMVDVPVTQIVAMRGYSRATYWDELELEVNNAVDLLMLVPPKDGGI